MFVMGVESLFRELGTRADDDDAGSITASKWTTDYRFRIAIIVLFLRVPSSTTLAMAETGPIDKLSPSLSKLPKVDKSGLLASFVKQQRQNAKVYEVEGQKYMGSWEPGKEKGRKAPPNSSSVVSNRARNADKDNAGGGERWGVTTPVLKPRNPHKVEVVGDQNKIYPNRHQGVVQGGVETLRIGEVAPASPPPRRLAKKANKSPKALKGAQRISDYESDCGTEGRERVSRMNARKERRRERREIVNPRKRRASVYSNSEEESEEESRVQKKKKGSKGKQQKIPAGLALMHCFSATNVGKSRLTMDPSARLSGVFSKGKASVKTTMAKKAAANSRFSESHFLNKHTPNGRIPTPEPKQSKHRSKGKSEKSKATKNENSKPASSKRKEVPSISESSTTSDPPDESLDEDEAPIKLKARRKQRVAGPASTQPLDNEEPPNRRKRASSITWDIERDSARLPSSDLSNAIPLESAVPGRQGQTSDELPIGPRRASVVSWHKTPSPSLGPHDSASQCISKTPVPLKEGKMQEGKAFSKYFGPSLRTDEEQNEEDRKEVSLTLICPAFPLAGGEDSHPASDTAKRRHPPTEPQRYPQETRDVPKASVPWWAYGCEEDEVQEKDVSDNLPPQDDEMPSSPTGRKPMSASTPFSEGMGDERRIAEPLHDYFGAEEWKCEPCYYEAGRSSLGGFLDEEPAGLSYLDGYGTTDEVELHDPWQGEVEPEPDTFYPEHGSDEEAPVLMEWTDHGGEWEDEIAEFECEAELGYNTGEGNPAEWGEQYGQQEDLYEDGLAGESPYATGYLDEGDCQTGNECVSFEEPNCDLEDESSGNFSELERSISGSGELEELGLDIFNSSTLQGPLQGDLCHFLTGRSALLGFDVELRTPRPSSAHIGGITKAEHDVAESLKNHWYPQRL
ncbi:hypothetical protein D9611_007746 [Ephemerocybe angulata]|uniref:Uncharacterized protein n=1 Tax=Ephemerocybe angulata TaxID=980116 RepID=A0A8H5BY30_9AGAR|nr:hypothetical protein D9611_007746 [Tulosesus angulatus]